jgi:hypothetical protein
MNSISRMPPGPSLTVLRQLAARHVAPHFGVQPAHCLERAVIEVLAVDERPHDRLQEFLIGSAT